MRNKKDIVSILISMSNNLDRKGYHKEADRIDFLIKKVAEDLAEDLEKEYSDEQIKHFDLDKDGKPFEKEDFDILNKNKGKKAKAARKNRLL